MAISKKIYISALPHELTPKVLQMIAEVCGDSIALAIWRHYGGGHLSVPSFVTNNHHLARNIGLEEANEFCAQFAGEQLLIPRGKRALDTVRNTLIRSQRNDGWSMFELARAHQLTTRQIGTICNSVALAIDDSQLDLFKN